MTRVRLEILPELTEGLVVKFDDVLSPASRRLMAVLGVTAVEPELELVYHVPASQVWPNSRGTSRGRVHLHLGGTPLCGKHARYEREPFPHEKARCKACDAAASRKGVEWPA